MPNERVILCGGAPTGNTPFPGAETVELAWNVGEKNVRVKIEDIRKPLWRDVPAQFQDLIDIAVYVYCADQAVRRGGDGVDNMGQDWRRSFFFRIPVRKPDFWSDAATKQELVSLLSFLSEDAYQFDFVALKEGRPFQTYCDYGEDQPLGGHIEEVVLYSGGLDSAAGAIQEVITDKRRIVLVTHSPTEKLINRHRELLFKLRQHSGQVPIEQIRVHVNKDEGLGLETTQRTRSFLYGALAATIAHMLNLNRIRFYENGVVSFNLPLAAQVVGARATRTTHPRVLKAFGRLFSMVATNTFTVENLFLWKTKTDVVKLIVDANCSDVIEHTTSCTHTRKATLENPHCGLCSQCIDRRFATLGADAADADPANYYAVDLLVGAREKSIDRTMLAAYVETAREIAHMDEMGFLSRYGEVSRLLRHIDGTPEAIASKVFELHQRHAKQVGKVITDGLRQHATAIYERTLPATCLLKQVDQTDTTIVVETRPVPAPVPSQPMSEVPVARTVDFFLYRDGAKWLCYGTRLQWSKPGDGKCFEMLMKTPNEWTTKQQHRATGLVDGTIKGAVSRIRVALWDVLKHRPQYANMGDTKGREHIRSMILQNATIGKLTRYRLNAEAHEGGFRLITPPVTVGNRKLVKR